MSGRSVRPFNVLVIGAGPAAVAMHLPVLAELRDRGRVALTLICDVRKDRARAARRQFGFLDDSGDGLGALELPEIDVVYIFGSAQLHCQYGLIALRNGKHLFVEKPVAPSHADACSLAETAREMGRIAVGGHNRRFYRSLDAVRERAGRATWHFAEAVFHKPEYCRPPPFGARTWLGANGIHALDTLIFMMGGVPEELTARAGPAGAEVPSTFSALMRWQNGAQGVFLCDNNAGSRREEYVFHGGGETLRVTEEGVTCQKDDTIVSLSLPCTGDGVAAEHAAFLQACAGGAAPRHSIAALAPSLWIAELIEAGYSGPVRLPDGYRAPPLPLPRAAPLARPAPPLGRALTPRTILVMGAAALKPALDLLTPNFRLVSAEDVLRAPVPRKDVGAVILGRGAKPLPAELLDKLPYLAVVGVVGLSVARFEPDSLLARGIAVVNASAAYADSVAEFALGLAILGRRRAFASHELMRAGGWGVSPPTAGLRGVLRRTVRRWRSGIKAAGLEPALLRLRTAVKPLLNLPDAQLGAMGDLAGATVGLIGWGANARAFAQRLAAARARVLAYSENAADEDIAAAGVQRVSLGDALAADVVSLHRGLNAGTRHCLGAAELERLRPGTVLINVARGALIEPRALLARLAKGDIVACLDTYDLEPLGASNPLRRLRNVFLTSHIAGGSTDLHAAAAEEVARKVADFLMGDYADSLSAARLHTMT